MLGRIVEEKSGQDDDRHVSMRLLEDDAPRSLTVGETRGHWFDVDEDVYCSDGTLTRDALGACTGFPRAWPECYTSCKPLRRLVGKKGIAGVRTGVVDIMDDLARAEIAPFLKAHGEESSFATATRVERRKGWPIVKGFVVYELLPDGGIDGDRPRAFVAHKHWWNIDPARGAFIDLTPASLDVHAEIGGARLRLLVESAHGDKLAETLRAEHIAAHVDAADAADAARVEAERARSRRPAAQGEEGSKGGDGRQPLVTAGRSGDGDPTASSSSSAVTPSLPNGLSGGAGGPSPAMLVLPMEAEALVEALSTFSVSEVGNDAWHRQRTALERLNLQAHQNVQSKSDEFVKSFLISHDKLPTLVHELLVTEVWREMVLPRLGAECFESSAARTNIYLAVYHEAVLVNILESALFHREACEALGDVAALEVVDYCMRRVTYLNSRAAQDDAEYKERDLKTMMAMNPRDELDERHAEVRLSVSLCSLSVLRYFTEYTNEMDLCVLARLLDTHDAIVQLVPLLEDKPWVRRRESAVKPDSGDGVRARAVMEVHDRGSWREMEASERQRIGSVDAQVWLSLNNLVVDRRARSKYEYDDFRKNTLVRLKRYFNEVLFDQLPVLKDLQRVIDEVILMATPSAAEVKQGRLILETVPEMRTAILASRDWAEVAREQGAAQFGCGEEAERATRERMKAMMESFDFMAQLEEASMAI